MWLDESNTTGDGSRALRTADGTAQIPDSGGFHGLEARPLGIITPDSQIVTVIDGLTPFDSYEIYVIYTAQWGNTGLALGAGLSETTTAQVDDVNGPFGSWLDEGSEENPDPVVGGSGTNSAARVWSTSLGEAEADENGTISVFVDHIVPTAFLNSVTSYNGVSFTPVETVLLGDVDMSGAVDFLDIAPFIALLSSGEFRAEADIDGSLPPLTKAS